MSDRTNEQNAYILGTEQAELHRLGLQHQVWSAEARKAWDTAEFGPGQTILDLGSGPGFCSMELAYIVGAEGKVIAIDKSKNFIDFLDQQTRQHGLNIKTQCASFENIMLGEDTLDGIYSRWALAWIAEPEKVLERIVKAMKPGAVFVAHEYYDWSTLQSQPRLEGLATGIAGALKSFKEQEGDIDIGRHLPGMCFDLGLEVIQQRPMAKLVTPQDLAWEWPRTFFNIYFPKLAETGFLTNEEMENALEDMDELQYINGSSIFCPMMTEVIAIKP